MTDKVYSEIRFIADEMLGRLAKWLRAIGYDTIYYSGGEDSGLVQQALEEDRTILTRDADLLKRKQVRKKEVTDEVSAADIDDETGLPVMVKCLIWSPGIDDSKRIAMIKAYYE